MPKETFFTAISRWRVVSRRALAQERGVVGETPNLAARLQSLSAPNTLVIAEATRRQIGGLFDLEDLGPQQLAGFGEPQHAWQVLNESDEVSRFEALRSGETPLVGREEELELLLRRWQQAKAGEGRVVLLSGEPGIGKSRLTAAILEQLEEEKHTRLRYFRSPHHQNSALSPVIGQLEGAAGFTRDDDAETKRDKLVALLGPAAESGDLSVLIELLSLPGGDRFDSICCPLSNPVRTAIGTFGGSLKDIPAPDLEAAAIKAAVAPAVLGPEEIGTVVMGNGIQASAKMNPERQAAIHAGLPVSVPALTVNRVLRFGIARGRWGYRMGDRQPYDSMQRHRRGRVMEGYVMDGGSTQCAHASALLQ